MCVCVCVCVLNTSRNQGIAPVLAICLHYAQTHNDLHARGDAAENRVFAVKPGRGSQGDEELAAIGVGTCIRHGQNAGAGVLELLFDLVLELGAKDAVPATASASGVSPLNHEVLDDAVEPHAVVVAAAAELREIQARFWSFIPIQLYGKRAKRCLESDTRASLEGKAGWVQLRHARVFERRAADG